MNTVCTTKINIPHMSIFCYFSILHKWHGLMKYMNPYYFLDKVFPSLKLLNCIVILYCISQKHRLNVSLLVFKNKKKIKYNGMILGMGLSEGLTYDWKCDCIIWYYCCCPKNNINLKYYYYFFFLLFPFYHLYTLMLFLICNWIIFIVKNIKKKKFT